MRECYSTASEIAILLYIQEFGFHFDDSVKKVAPYQLPDKGKPNRWVASTLNAPDIYLQYLQGGRVVMILWPTIWLTNPEIRDVTKHWWDKYWAKNPTDYDRCYRDEEGVFHAVIASGVVVVEKNGEEPPLDE
jgi:hypothetical protein